MPSTLANFRVLQCVLPSGGRCRVLAKMRASIAGVRTVAGCPRYFACSPASRSVSNRLFPATDVIRITAHRGGDDAERLARREHQNDLGPTRILRANLATSYSTFQFLRSSAVNVSAIWRSSIALVIQW